MAGTDASGPQRGPVTPLGNSDGRHTPHTRASRASRYGPETVRGRSCTASITAAECVAGPQSVGRRLQAVRICVSRAARHRQTALTADRHRPTAVVTESDARTLADTAHGTRCWPTDDTPHATDDTRHATEDTTLGTSCC